MSSNSPSRSITPIVLVASMIVAGGIAAWFFWPSEQTPTVVEPPPEVPVVDTQSDKPIQPTEEVIEELRGSGPLDRWLAIPNFIKRIAAATWRVSLGQSPTPVLGFLTLSGHFEVEDEGEQTFISPQQYRRYDAIIDRIVAVEPDKAGAAYKRLQSNFEAAFAELNEPVSFHEVAKKAVKRVLEVEVPEGRIEVVGKGATFFYVDESLEALDAADKHVIRLGPKNAERVQTWLRQVAEAGDLL